MSENNETKTHSQDYFGEWRDFWWNQDFIKLIAKRWNLNNVNTVLDVGCGVGHWGRVLMPFFSKSALLSGIDMETISVSKAKSLAQANGTEDRCTYSVARAESIPFPSDSFDMVTCQTLLIHVPDVIKVLTEMKRVLKPNGLLMVAEPNNAISNLIENSFSFNDPIETKLKRIHFALTCEYGKASLGLGHNSIGDLIPKMFAQLNLSNIKVYQSDKAFSYIPPYDSVEQKANIKQALEWSENEFFMWESEEAKKYFLAGGGSITDFNSYWELIRKENLRFKEGIMKKNLYMAGGSLLYLISGRK